MLSGASDNVRGPSVGVDRRRDPVVVCHDLAGNRIAANAFESGNGWGTPETISDPPTPGATG